MRLSCLLPAIASPSSLSRLVPDGATGVLSVDAQPFIKSDAARIVELAKQSDAEVAEVLTKLKDDCKLDYTVCPQSSSTTSRGLFIDKELE
ncbi:MAG: hypothetical protein JKY37_18040 [Nannocystaceae bacterium]|nr:hypothetical protein [Nannocystaceae bacterium]